MRVWIVKYKHHYCIYL